MPKPTTFLGTAKAGDLPAQKKMNELLRSGLAKGGVDFEELEKFYRQSVSEFAEEKKKLLAQTNSYSAGLSGDFERDLQSLRKRLDQLLLIPPLTSPTQLYLLDTATNITATRISLDSTNLARMNNWAQFDFSTKDTSIATVDFSYQWTNPADNFAVINVLGFISFNGALVASTDGSMWPIDHQHAHTSIDAYLSVNTSGAIYTGTSINASIFNADSGGGWFGNPGVYKTATVFRGLPVTEDVLLVGPQATIQIDVIGQFSSEIDSGYADYNFKDEGRQVTSAGAIVSVVS